MQKSISRARKRRKYSRHVRVVFISAVLFVVLVGTARGDCFIYFFFGEAWHHHAGTWMRRQHCSAAKEKKKRCREQKQTRRTTPLTNMEIKVCRRGPIVCFNGANEIIPLQCIQMTCRMKCDVSKRSTWAPMTHSQFSGYFYTYPRTILTLLSSKSLFFSQSFAFLLVVTQQRCPTCDWRKPKYSQMLFLGGYNWQRAILCIDKKRPKRHPKKKKLERWLDISVFR